MKKDILNLRLSEGQILWILSALYFISRLLFLTKLPIFNDEAIYLDWGYKEINYPNNLFMSLFDAKQPLLMWIFGISQKLFSNPLFAGRVVSVIAGFLSLIGIYKLSELVFNKRVAITASVFYILSLPFLFFNRQALMESAITACGIWVIYLLLKIFKELNLKHSISLGVVLGIGFFIKTSSLVFFLSTLTISLLLIKASKTKDRLINLLALSIVISQIILIPLYMQSEFWETLYSNSRYTLSLNELINFPIKVWISNFAGSTEIIFYWISPFVVIISIFGLFLLLKNDGFLKKIIVLWFIITYAVYLFTSRSTSLRYMVPYLFPLLIFFASALNSFKLRKFAKFVLATLSIAPSVILILLLIFSPLNFFNTLDKFTSQSIKRGYMTSWTSGCGVFEAVEFIKNSSETALIGVRLDAGNPESAMFAYFNSSNKYKVVYFDENYFGQEILNYECLSSSIPFYFVSRDEHLGGMNKFLVETKRYYKPENERFIGIYNLKKDCEGKTLKLI